MSSIPIVSILFFAGAGYFIYNGVVNLKYANDMTQNTEDEIASYRKIRERGIKFLVFSVAFIVIALAAIIKSKYPVLNIRA